MALRSRGHAVLGILKLVGIGAGGLLVLIPLMRYAVEQAAAGTDPTVLWLALAVVVPMILVFIGWMVRDSGNLRELTGRYNATDKRVEKIDDGQERIFRELGGAKEFRENMNLRLERMQEDLSQQDQFRHDLRDELAPKLTNSQLAAFEKMDRLEERIRALEMRSVRGGT